MASAAPAEQAMAQVMTGERLPPFPSAALVAAYFVSGCVAGSSGSGDPGVLAVSGVPATSAAGVLPVSGSSF
jgi:hypothetical protein